MEVSGDQQTEVVFLLKPLFRAVVVEREDGDVEGGGGGVDIDREVAFVSADGTAWRAEG